MPRALSTARHDVGLRVVSRPDVVQSQDPYSLWTGSVCGRAHAPSVAHATDVWRNLLKQKCDASVAHTADVVIRFAKKVTRFFVEDPRRKRKAFFLLLLLATTSYYC